MRKLPVGCLPVGREVKAKRCQRFLRLAAGLGFRARMEPVATPYLNPSGDPIATFFEKR